MCDFIIFFARLALCRQVKNNHRSSVPDNISSIFTGYLMGMALSTHIRINGGNLVYVLCVICRCKRAFVAWLRFTIGKLSGVFGHVKEDGGGSTLQLTYAKERV